MLGELISNMWCVEVHKDGKNGTDKRRLNTFMKRVLGSIDK
jgi:hypothetical protein